MAARVCFLTTEAHYVTGQGIDVDGGYQRALLELHGQLVPSASSEHENIVN